MNEEKVAQRAREFFNAGWNCAESVFQAVAHELGVEVDPKVMTGFGGGFGGARCVCGALTGAVAGCNLKYGRSKPDPEAKKRAYEKAKSIYDAFREKFHTVHCFEITGCTQDHAKIKEICTPVVEEAARIAIAVLKEG